MAAMNKFPDILLAQLLDMGFSQNDIAACQLALCSSSSTPVTLQAATEWLLQSSSQYKTTPIPTTTTTAQSSTVQSPSLILGTSSGNHSDTSTSGNHGNSEDLPALDYSKPMSSGSRMTYAAPLTSRYDLSDEKRKQKEQYISKERDDAVKKARERRLAEMRAKAVVKQQIEEDKQRRAEKTGHKQSSLPSPVQQQPVTTPTTATTTTTAVKPSSNSGQCRVQVRLLDGSMLRSLFSSDSTLNDVCNFIIERYPQLTTNIQLVQPFPRKEFSLQEHSQTLQSLNLCPSASLVVSKPIPLENEQTEQMDTTEPLQEDPGLSSLPGQPEEPADDDKEEDNEQNNDQVNIMPHPQQPWPAPPRGAPPHHGPFPVPPRGVPPRGPFPPPGRLPFPPPGRLPFPPPQLPPPMHQGPGMAFEGEGHRLGGKEAPMKFGDPQSMSKYVTDTARNAAEKRAQIFSRMSSENRITRLTPEIPRLETLCLRALARWSSVNWLPNCSHLPPRVAHNILIALTEAKQLHPKTLNVFMKCPIQNIVLDNYPYATNQLLDMFKYFPTITHLSLVSCTLITDKSLMQLLPYLSHLKFLSLNECHQLSDDVFQNFNGFNDITVLRLGSLKLTDTGIMYLTRNSLPCLVELDVSFTNLTSKGLDRLGQKVPNIKNLNIESTQVTDISPVLCLKSLSILNVSNCPLSQGNVYPLANCVTLSSLNLGGLPIDVSQLSHLVGLSLTSLMLPDRNVFYDDHMSVVANFPLTCLNLTGYRNITDHGISCISTMKCLNQLFLGRTKLTDIGMTHLTGLVNLKQLSLDNTIITDQGIMSVSDLILLEDLSLSDTRVTSKFICDGALSKLTKLAKLNLVRTYVDDTGILALCSLSLVMLNVDWTCISTNITIDVLREKGCRSLETFRNKNIEQPKPGQQQPVPQVQHVPPPWQHQQYDEDMSSDDDDY